MGAKKGCIPWNKGIPCSAETKKKISEANKGRQFWLGKHHTKETRQKISKAQKGNQSWLGRSHTKEAKKKISETKKAQFASGELTPWNRGKTHSKETREKIGELSRGRQHSNKTKEKISASLKRGKHWLGKKHTEKTKQKISKALKVRMKALWENHDFVRMMLKARNTKPNKAEKFLFQCIEEVCPNKYGMNQKAKIVVLGRKIPDFVNINGKKKLIELFGDYWHNPKYFPNVQTPEERIDYFSQFGWDTLIIWEKELRDLESLKRKITEFTRDTKESRCQN